MLGVLAVTLSLQAADWPRLGGPEEIGVSPETGLARSWPETGPKIRWTVDVGEGYAGPAISGDEVFLLDRVPDVEDVLRCFDLEKGNEKWHASWKAPGTLANNNGSRNVPTVDGDRVYALGPRGALKCVDRHTGKILWAAHLVEDFKDPQIDVLEPAKTRDEKLLRAQVPLWGLTQAPLIYKNSVIVAPQTQKTGVVAYDKKNGKLLWRSGYVGRNWYSHVSPCLARFCGVDQVVLLAQPSDPEKTPREAPPALITSIDPTTGSILWTNQTPCPYKIPIPQPLPIGNDRLFITGGYGMGSMMLQITHNSNQWQTKLLFHNSVAASHIHSPILYKDRIYVTSFKEHGAEKTGLVCMDTNGAGLWQTGPTHQFDNGGFLVADGMIYIMNGKTGMLSLYELGGEQPRLLSSAKILDAENGNVWAPLALSNGHLLVRDQHQVKCLDVR